MSEWVQDILKERVNSPVHNGTDNIGGEVDEVLPGLLGSLVVN